MAPTESKSSAALRDQIRIALNGQTAGKQRPATVTVLSSLLAVQDDLHYIPVEAVEEVAQYCDSTINDVWSVASFYTNFRFSPPGQVTVDVCWGPTCHLMGAQDVLRAVHDAMDVEGEDTTQDGKLTLRYSTCLGACGQAPVIARDHVLRGNVDPESAREFVATVSKELDNGYHH